MRLFELAGDTKNEITQDDKIESLTDLFDKFDGDVKQIKWLETFYAREIDKPTSVIAKGKKTLVKPGNYLLRSALSPKSFKIISQRDFDNEYSQIRVTDKPDAEGFVLVKQNDNVEGFQYNEDDTLKINSKNEHLVLKKSMWVLRYIDDVETTWTISDAEFNKTFKL